MERPQYNTDGEASETLTEPDTDTDEQMGRELGMVWVGSYLLELQSPPATPQRGWTAGKGLLENIPIDLLSCTRAFAKTHDVNSGTLMRGSTSLLRTRASLSWAAPDLRRLS